jgi:hypothetical protein
MLSAFVRFVVLFAKEGRENFFQSLENCRKIFPMVGKNGVIFPTIGKKVSNHWKTWVLPASYQIGQNPGGKAPCGRSDK